MFRREFGQADPPIQCRTMRSSDSQPQRSPVVVRALACIGAVAVSALAVPATTGAVPRPTLCGHVQGTVAIAAHQVACPRARGVAEDYLHGHKNPDGFRCRRYNVDVAAGWWAKCTRHTAYVQITPE